MSFDIYFQRFENGDAGSGGGAAAAEALRAFLRPSPENPQRVEHPGGSAEIYGLSDSGMMATHVAGGGEEIWDLLVSTARVANWTIMPVGCPVCVFTAEMEAALPEGLGVGVEIIESGADLLRVIAES
ncbi:hypothetical protein ACTJI8_11870 [Microbacterium sp. 22303]|uniref:hypothetical protein n=1 Tax=Microbacterium sp. 22303 TaxID=3453905 RepID=UPI003F8413EA